MDSRSSSERTGSVASAADLGHQKKLSLQTKNDPNLALQEQQPTDVSGSSLNSLQSMQHVDRFGKPITDPDLSNPTRYRFERPLDTIRSFESNIARNHKQHKIIP